MAEISSPQREKMKRAAEEVAARAQGETVRFSEPLDTKDIVRANEFRLVLTLSFFPWPDCRIRLAFFRSIAVECSAAVESEN